MAALGDLDLALLVSLVAEQHCIFSAAVESIATLQEQLRLSCVHTFGISPAIVECSAHTTVDEFNNSLLIEIVPRIADIVIATRLDTTDESVQVQALELIHSRRIFSRSEMHIAPKNMLFISILSTPHARLIRHLNDTFCMSHFHPAEDTLSSETHPQEKPPLFDQKDLDHLRDQTQTVHLTAEIAQYLHNVVIFLRNSRYVTGGVTATATRHLRTLSRALAPLHGWDYVPPSLVALAARKIYPHRLVLATPQTERSVMWGSDPEAIEELLQGVTVEDVIEDVLSSLETPL